MVQNRFGRIFAALLAILTLSSWMHLATASEHGATVHTLDQRLADAGPVLGVPTQLLR